MLEKKEDLAISSEAPVFAGERSETTMGASSYEEDGIVHSFSKEKVKKNLETPVQIRPPQIFLIKICEARLPASPILARHQRRPATFFPKTVPIYWDGFWF